MMTWMLTDRIGTFGQVKTSKQNQIRFLLKTKIKIIESLGRFQQSKKLKNDYWFLCITLSAKITFADNLESVARDSINAVILRLEHFCQIECDSIGLV